MDFADAFGVGFVGLVDVLAYFALEVGDGAGLGAFFVGAAVGLGAEGVALAAEDFNDFALGFDDGLVLAHRFAQAQGVVNGGVGRARADVADVALDPQAVVGERTLQVSSLADRVLADLG